MVMRLRYHIDETISDIYVNSKDPSRCSKDRPELWRGVGGPLVQVLQTLPVVYGLKSKLRRNYYYHSSEHNCISQTICYDYTLFTLLS